jgi:hypothetical protein
MSGRRWLRTRDKAEIREASGDGPRRCAARSGM